MTSALFRARAGLNEFDFALCARRPGPLMTDLGVPILIEHDLELMTTADLILVLPGAELDVPPDDPVLDALRAAHQHGATLAAHCLGVFTLAATGLLGGLEVTTRHASDARYAAGMS